jgi:hypothetical protein
MKSKYFSNQPPISQFGILYNTMTHNYVFIKIKIYNKMNFWKQLVQQSVSMGNKEQVLQFVKKYSWIVDKDVSNMIKTSFDVDLEVTSPKHNKTIDNYLNNTKEMKMEYFKKLLLDSYDHRSFPAEYYYILAELAVKQSYDNEFIQTILTYGCMFSPGELYNLVELYIQKGGINSIKLMLNMKLYDQKMKMINMLYD